MNGSSSNRLQARPLAQRLGIPLLAALIAGLWIYTRSGPSPEPSRQPHPPGAHGGAVTSFAGDRFHAEAVLEREGLVRVFLLGADASQLIDVERQSPTAYVRDAADGISQPVVLEPTPQPGDAAGRTSQFVGRLPESTAQPDEITIAALHVAGGRYNVRFRLGPAHEPPMPEKVGDEQERALYLVAGGRYTAADIEANGRVTASQKFRAFKPRHDFRPLPGDRLCPITRTKAHRDCTWIIGGKTYEFCCPPCVDEFVRLAKEEPEKVRDPSAYVKR